LTNDNNDPDEPTEPGPLAIVDNKEDAMKTVIKQQLIYINKLRLQNNELKNLVERKQKELEHYLKPIENLEDEFKICEEDIGFSDVGVLDKVVDKLKFFEYGITLILLCMRRMRYDPREVCCFTVLLVAGRLCLQRQYHVSLTVIFLRFL